MTLVFPIVGLSYFVDNIAEMIAAIEQHPSLQLMCDNGNPYSAHAIGVYWACQQIGMVEDDYARIIRASLPDVSTMDAQFYTTDYESKKMFWAQIEVEQVAKWEHTLDIDLTPVLQMPWPKVGDEHVLLLDTTYNYCNEARTYIQQTDEQGRELVFPEGYIPSLVEVCNRFAEQYGASLSGDDRRVYMTLDWLMEDVIEQWRKVDEPTAAELYEPLCHLRDIHRHYANNSDRCAKVYIEERKRVHKALVDTLFLSDYQTYLESQHISLRQQQHEQEQWLMALPEKVFMFYKTDIKRFASKLFYLRLSWDQLLAVYVHLECLELLMRLQGQRLTARRQNLQQEPSALNNDKILLCSNYSQKKFMQLDSSIREFLRKKPHRKTTKLALFVIQGELNHVFVRNMGDNAKQFITAFCQEYNVHVDYSDFKKAYDQYMRAYRKHLEEEDGYLNEPN